MMVQDRRVDGTVAADSDGRGRIVRFTVQLRALNGARVPLGGLVASHVVESLALIPVMIGVLMFLFEFFEDQVQRVRRH
jgi:hypothetical protein